jgi:hypothetical protein
MRRTKLNVVGTSDTAAIKREIQDTLRDIVILRDGGCIFRNYPGHICSGFANDGHLILQADHLITRGNAATYADSRLVVCVCKGIHGWKSFGSNLNKKQYDEMVRTLLPPERVKLWDACERDSWKPNRGAAYNWAVTLACLRQELRQMS